MVALKDGADFEENSLFQPGQLSISAKSLGCPYKMFEN